MTDKNNTDMKPTNIGVVVVVFHPDARQLEQKLARLGSNVAVAVVDNTPDETIDIAHDNIAYIPLHDNTGIANAQNEGIRYLMEHGCTHIVFFDQDSEYNIQYVEAIVAEYGRIASRRKNLFLLGPTVIDKDSSIEYKSLAGDCEDNGSFVLQRELISSGTCASVDNIRKVGLLKSRMFIDYVDFEWCWRAESLGFVCGMTRNVRLPHKVGVRQKRILGMVFIESAPFRYFYQYRNLTALCRLNYVPKQWKRKKLLRKAIELVVLPATSSNGWAILRNSLRGIAAGTRFKWNE